MARHALEAASASDKLTDGSSSTSSTPRSSRHPTAPSSPPGGGSSRSGWSTTSWRSDGRAIAELWRRARRRPVAGLRPRRVTLGSVTGVPDDLFSAAVADHLRAQAPLAARLRPRTIDEVVGQEHLVGPNRPLRRLVELDRLSSAIFWGPPGTGKTTLALAVAGTTERGLRADVGGDRRRQGRARLHRASPAAPR